MKKKFHKIKSIIKSLLIINILYFFTFTFLPITNTKIHNSQKIFYKINALENHNINNRIGSSAEERLNQVREQINQIKKKKQDLQATIDSEKSKQGQVNNEIKIVSAERDLIQSDINTKELTIEELELQIDILKDSITKTKKVINQNEEEIKGLEKKADKQLKSMYYDLKTKHNGINLVLSTGGTDIVKNGMYQTTIQEDTNSSLRQLKEISDKLKEDKKELEQNKTAVINDKKKIDQEKKELEEKRSELQSKMNKLVTLYNQSQSSIENNKQVLNSLSDEEAKLLAEQELIMQQLMNQVGEIKNGQYVKKGTIIGYQGLTGLTTGYHLHFAVIKNGSYNNPCSYLPPGQFSYCSGNSELDWPMKGSYYFTSAYGWRTLGGRTSFHYAIDIAHPNNNTPIYAAHDGWYTRGFQPCNPNYWLCKGGGANYVILCENKDNCNSGFKTMYYHLK